MHRQVHYNVTAVEYVERISHDGNKMPQYYIHLANGLGRRECDLACYDDLMNQMARFIPALPGFFKLVAVGGGEEKDACWRKIPIVAWRLSDMDLLEPVVAPFGDGGFGNCPTLYSTGLVEWPGSAVDREIWDSFEDFISDTIKDGDWVNERIINNA